MEEFYVSGEIEHLAEIISGRLYFGVTYADTTKLVKNNAENFYFTIDDELVYLNYYYDFGPLNISCLYKYCNKLNTYLQSAPTIKRVIHYTSRNEEKRSNAAFLMGAYAVIYLKMEPKQIMRILLSAGGSFRHFVDASQGLCQHTIRIVDCLNGLEKAMRLNFFNFDDFNTAEYDLYDKLQNGDLNWLVPRKFLAFIGPTEDKFMINGHTPEFYIKYFLQNDVQAVIRLNNKAYDRNNFVSAGIKHHDLFFPDGTTPPKNILLQFLEIAENCPTALAVHCKAGLGRTGSLIGAYIIKHYHLTAREAIAWMRICRPGSVIGQQQGWLEKIEGWLWRQGGQYRLQNFGDGDKLLRHKFGIYSLQWQVERKRLIHLAHRRGTSTPRQSARARIEQTNIIEEYTPKKLTAASAESRPLTQKDVKLDYDRERIPSANRNRATKLLSTSAKTNVSFQTDISKVQHNLYEKTSTTNNYDRIKKLSHRAFPKEAAYEYYSRERTRPKSIKTENISFSKINKPFDEKEKKTVTIQSGSKSIDNKDMGASIGKKGTYRRKVLQDDMLYNASNRNIDDILKETQGDKLNKIKTRRIYNSTPHQHVGFKSR